MNSIILNYLKTQLVARATRLLPAIKAKALKLIGKKSAK